MTEAGILEKAAELFNRRMYFECHDLLEEAWSEARGEERSFLNGLIHLAVGMYHLAAGNHRGAESQLEKAVRRLEPFEPEWHGLDIGAIVAGARLCLVKVERALHGEAVSFEAEEIPQMRFRRLT